MLIAAVRAIPIDPEIAIKALVSPGEFHQDLADRMIAATAHKLGIALVSADEKIRA